MIRTFILTKSLNSRIQSHKHQVRNRDDHSDIFIHSNIDIFSITCRYYQLWYIAQANAQTVVSPDLAKVLIDSAMQALQSGDIKKTVMHLGAAEQEVI